MTVTHGFARLVGRDPHQPHRSATPLELLFDLTFVVAFSQAASQAAHFFELGHTMTGVIGFALAAFAVTWAWINYSWLASAYDTDDVFFRLATFVQMIGVVVLALGLPVFFQSIDEGDHLDNSLMIAGYVIMRISVISLWLRAALHNPLHRATCVTYATGIAVVQAGWIIAIFVNPPLWPAIGLMVALGITELTIPVLAERRGTGTPWHAHHIAERYGLLVIITLGEVILGTVIAISAVVETQGWTVEAILVAFGGLLLAFCMWWAYFTIPAARVLAAHRERAFGWGYTHIALFGAAAAVGAGLHVAAYVISGEAHVDRTYALMAIAIPVLIFASTLAALHSLLLRRVDVFHLALLTGTIAMLTIAVIASLQGASLGVTIVIVALAPAVGVVSYETAGHRHLAKDLHRLG